VFLIIVDQRGHALDPARRAGSTLYGTLEGAAVSFARWSVGAGRVQALERENARLRTEIMVNRQRDATSTQVNAVLAANQDVRAAAREAGFTVVPAQVVAFSGRQGHEATVTIDAGSQDGVTRDLTVMNSGGLVGRVIQAGPASATVLLATDTSSSVGTRMADSGELGLVTGLPAEGLLRLKLLNPQAPLRVGQRVVTLGSDNLRPYVPGVPVGTVISVERTPGAPTRTALVRPSAGLTTLGVVAVVVAAPRGDAGPTGAAGPGRAEAGATPGPNPGAVTGGSGGRGGAGPATSTAAPGATASSRPSGTAVRRSSP
jgi:rod shape-determining protein MreC